MTQEQLTQLIHTAGSRLEAALSRLGDGIAWAGFWFAVGMIISAAIMKGLIT